MSATPSGGATAWTTVKPETWRPSLLVSPRRGALWFAVRRTLTPSGLRSTRQVPPSLSLRAQACWMMTSTTLTSLLLESPPSLLESTLLLESPPSLLETTPPESSLELLESSLLLE